MRVRLIILLLFCLSLTMPACAQSNSGQADKHAPKIKFDLEQFDFGEVDEGILAKHIFKFKNTGEDTLRINRIDPG